MWKYFLLIQSQSKDHKEMKIFFAIELFIAIVALNMVLVDFKEFYEKNSLYHHLELEDMDSVMGDKEGELKALKKKGEILWYSKIPTMGTLDRTVEGEHIQVDFLTEELVEGLKKVPVNGRWMDSKNTRISQAVVPKELSDEYQLGKTYKENLSQSEGTITFQVVGILEKDSMFQIPNEDYASIIEMGYKNILVYEKNNRSTYVVSEMPVYLAKFKGKDSLHHWLGNSKHSKEGKGINRLQEVWKEQKTYEVGKLIVPGLVGSVIFILCIVGLVSFSLISTISKEKSYGIFYMNGATNKEICMIQIITDSVPVLAAMGLSQGGLLWSDMTYETNLFSVSGGLFSLSLCVVIIMVVAYICISNISKKNPIYMIRKWE